MYTKFLPILLITLGLIIFCIVLLVPYCSSGSLCYESPNIIIALIDKIKASKVILSLASLLIALGSYLLLRISKKFKIFLWLVVFASLISTILIFLVIPIVFDAIGGPFIQTIPNI